MPNLINLCWLFSTLFFPTCTVCRSRCGGFCEILHTGQRGIKFTNVSAKVEQLWRNKPPDLWGASKVHQSPLWQVVVKNQCILAKSECIPFYVTCRRSLVFRGGEDAHEGIDWKLMGMWWQGVWRTISLSFMERNNHKNGSSWFVQYNTSVSWMPARLSQYLASHAQSRDQSWPLKRNLHVCVWSAVFPADHRRLIMSRCLSFLPVNHKPVTEQS